MTSNKQITERMQIIVIKINLPDIIIFVVRFYKRWFKFTLAINIIEIKLDLIMTIKACPNFYIEMVNFAEIGNHSEKNS